MDLDSARKRIVARVNISETGCWEWSLKIRSNGYARMTFKGKSWYAHRLSFLSFKGDIPDGFDVCHSCDNRKCVNPSHLFAGTRRENMVDCCRKGRQAKGLSLPQAKLSEKDIKEIMIRVGNGDLYKDIAKDYGVARTSIGRQAVKHNVRRRNVSK